MAPSQGWRLPEISHVGAAALEHDGLMMAALAWQHEHGDTSHG